MSINRHARIVLAAIFALVPGATFLGAHHSFAMFDTANPITLCRRRHGIRVDQSARLHRGGRARRGRRVKHWTIELGSPSILMRGGWKFNTLKKGDKVTAVVSPLRNGDPGSLLNRITLADGRVLGNGGPAASVPASPRTAAPPRRATAMSAAARMLSRGVCVLLALLRSRPCRRRAVDSRVRT